MKTIAHPALAAIISLLCGYASFSVNVFFDAAYSGVPLPTETEIAIRHGGLLYFAAVPAVIVCLFLISRKYKKEDFGNLACYLIAILGLALLALGINAPIAKTTFGLSGA